MTDPIDAVRHSGGAFAPAVVGAADASHAAASASAAGPVAEPASALLARVQSSIEQARALGAEAERAAADVRTGRADDVEGVLLATRKADAAFRMLEAARNAMLEAYAQVRDLR